MPVTPSAERLLLAPLLLGLLLGGCGEADAPGREGLLLVVNADAELREALGRVEVEVAARGPEEAAFGPPRRVGLEAGDPRRWPRRGAISPAGAPDGRRVRVTIFGYRAGEEQPAVATRAETGFAPGSWRRLELWLLSSCLGVRCGPEERCVDGACEPVAFEDPESLPEAAPQGLGGACQQDAACDDGDPCTVDRCVDGRCVNGRPEDGGLAFRKVALGVTGFRPAYPTMRACAIDVLGRLWCWGGLKGDAVLGEGAEARLRPALVEGLQGVVDVAVGAHYHLTCVALGERGARCWREPFCEDDGAGGQRCGPPGALDEPQRIEVPGRIVQATIGGVSYCFRSADGAVHCGGENDLLAVTGRRGPSPPLWTVVPVEGLPPLRHVQGTPYGVLGVDREDTFWQWGGVFDGYDDLELRENRTVWPVRDACPRPSYRVCVVDQAGRYTCFAHDQLDERDACVPAELRALRVRRCTSAPCVIGVGGRLWCWQYEGSGVCGQTGVSSGPVQRVPGLSDVVQVAAAGSSFCAVDARGRLYCWGANRVGQLGVGDREDRSEPVRVGAELRCP